MEVCCRRSTCALILLVTLGLQWPDGDGQDAAEEVEILAAVQVPDVLHLAAVGDQRLLVVVGDGGPEVFLVLGDDFVAARAASELGCGNELCWCGHGRVLMVSSGWSKVYDGASVAARDGDWSVRRCGVPIWDEGDTLRAARSTRRKQCPPPPHYMDECQNKGDRKWAICK